MTEQTAEQGRRAAISGRTVEAPRSSGQGAAEHYPCAEGERQSKILRRGTDVRILQAQGGRRAAHHIGRPGAGLAGVTALSLNALKQMADGQATKIIFRSNSTIVKQAAEH